MYHTLVHMRIIFVPVKRNKECYERKKCKYRQSLRSNTVMHGSQLPFHDWFIAIQMLTYTKKSISAKEQIGKVLPWVHIAISNAKRTLLDIFHDIAPGYLQNYLNEFCWKFNRRYFGEALFGRLVVTAASYKNDFRYNIG